MGSPFVLIGLVRFSLKRLRSRPWLTLLALVGIILAVGLVNSAGFFAQAVDQVILEQELDELSRVTGRPPFSTRVYMFPSARFPVSVRNAEDLAPDVANTLASEVGLPIKHIGLLVDSGSMMLRPSSDDTRYSDAPAYLGTVSLAYSPNIEDHLDFVTGEPLRSDTASAGDVLDVWMHATLAEEMGIHPGERFDISLTLRHPPRKIRIQGLWQAHDPREPFWFNNPDTTLRDTLLVRRNDYIRFVEPMMASKSSFVSWHIILEDQNIDPANARDHAFGIERGMAIINKFVPGARLDVSPLEPLKTFVQRQTTLTTLLLGFNVPAFGFLLYFLILISVIIAQAERRETAVLISRGISPPRILALTLLEEGLLFVIGLPAGIALGMWLARMMGYTVSFLSFTDRAPLPVSLRGMEWPLMVAALGFAALSRLIPVLQATRRSAVEQEREYSRPQQRPFWQRTYLDLLLVLPTLYAYDQLTKKGTLGMLVQDKPEDLFTDPLLILVPALFILTTTLLIMRIFPLGMNLLDQLASLTPWTFPHLALRQLGRYSQEYINPLLLIIVALALGIYTLSMAASLDQWLIDRIYYRVGTDLSFLPFIETDDEASMTLWVPTPDEFIELPGVMAASRVGDYGAEIRVTDNTAIRGRFLGIDRLTFPQVAWFRPDFAREPLGGLMNLLALAPEHILVSQAFLDANHLQIGDQITIRIGLDAGVGVTSLFKIAGVYNYFPTVYQDRITVIGNLEHIYTLAGATFPYRIWLRLAPEADPQTTLQAVLRKGVEPIVYGNAPLEIATEQAKMERVGIFGTLTMGFLASGLMAAMALLVHSFASLHERLYQFGVLRAVGLMRRQVIGQVFLEYSILTAYGAIAGATIGALTSQFFTPFFRITGERGIPLPPLIPIVAQDEIVPLAVVFTGILIFIELGVIGRTLNRGLFNALRMGHQG